jgi:hypothetical protein
MNTKQKIGGASRSVSDLLRIWSIAAARIKPRAIQAGLVLLLFACMLGVSLAQVSQNNLEFGNRTAFEDMAAFFGSQAVPGGLLEENSPQTDGFENIEKKAHRPRDEFILNDAASSTDMSSPEPPKGDIVISLFNGKGFALKGNETHILRMNMELIKDVDPEYLRDLMTSNKSIEDIEEELNTEEGKTALRGGLRINESGYSLLNIKFTQAKNNTTLIDADVAEPYLKPAHGKFMRPNTNEKIVFAGHIRVTVAPSADGLIGKGELVMSSDEYGGEYIVLLHMQKPLPADILPVEG